MLQHSPSVQGLAQWRATRVWMVSPIRCPEVFLIGIYHVATQDLGSDPARAVRRLVSSGLFGASRPDREYEETCEKLTSVAPYVVRAS